MWKILLLRAGLYSAYFFLFKLMEYSWDFNAALTWAVCFALVLLTEQSVKK
jgi:hypothetical protein